MPKGDTVTPEQLNEIENRANLATQGPWVALGNDVAAEVKTCTCYGGQAPYGHYQFCGLDGPLITGAAPQDAAFIATARTDVPALVAEVRRLRSQTQQLLTDLKNATDTQYSRNLVIMRLRQTLGENND